MGQQNFTTIANNSFAAGKFVSTPDAQGNVLLIFLPTPAPVISPALTGAGTTSVAISWSAVAGVTYQVQATTNLASPNWLPAGNILAQGTNATFNDNPPPQPQRFYRVIIP